VWPCRRSRTLRRPVLRSRLHHAGCCELAGTDATCGAGAYRDRRASVMPCSFRQCAELCPSANLNIGPRVPQINPNVARGDVAIRAMRTPTPNLATRINVNPTMPYLHYSPNLYPSCGAAFRDSDGECLGEPVSSGGNGASGGGNGASGEGKSKGSGRSNTVQSALNLRTYANRIVAEIDGTLSEEQADAVARRHGLRRLASEAFPLIGATIGLFQITDGRSYEAASRDFAAASGVASVQPDFRYLLQEQKTARTEGDPAQYALA